MKKRLLLLPLLAVLPGLAAAGSSFIGTLTSGGGVDDMHVIVQSANGRRVMVYCDGHCGDWFDENTKDATFRLKKQLVGQRVFVDFETQRNQDRIAGPGNDEILNFASKIELRK
jgi:hypothetical protein